MNKKNFALLMVIALILSSFTSVYANNNGGNTKKEDKTPNKKIHVHLQSGKEDISQVFVVINGEEIELLPSGNSGKYSVPKGVDPVSKTLTEIIVIYNSNETDSFTPAEDSQQGQEGQGSINYRINTTKTIGTDDDNLIEDDIDDIDDNEEENGDSVEGGGETIIDGGNIGNESGDNNTGNSNTGDNTGEGNAEDSDITDDFEYEIELIISDETPHGTPELESQEITSNEETTLDMEEEETPLDLPSTGVSTPLLYGAGALISLIGLFKRR